MAEALLKHICVNKYTIFSAGIKPCEIRPEAIKVIGELGLNISDYRSKSAEEFANRKIDFVLTVCDNAKETCPVFPAATKVIHKSFKDPAAIKGDYVTRLNAFRKTRNKINIYLPVFLEEIEAAGT